MLKVKPTAKRCLYIHFAQKTILISVFVLNVCFTAHFVNETGLRLSHVYLLAQLDIAVIRTKAVL